MSTAIFPTTSLGIPIHPEPSVFETVAATVLADDGVTDVDSVVIDQIQARPKWDFDEADDRLRGERIEALQKEVDAFQERVTKKAAEKRPPLPQRRPVKKAAAKKTTPRKKP